MRLGADAEVHALSNMNRKGMFRDAKLVSYQPDFDTVPIVRRLGWSTPMFRSIARSDAQVIHSHGLWMFPNIYRWRGQTESRRLFVISPRGMLSPVALSFSRLPKLAFSFLAQNSALSEAGLFHATSDEEANDIRAFGLTQPIAVIPNGIELSSIPLVSVPPRRRTLLSLGRIHPKKGLDTLIQAWARVEDHFPNWELLIVGPDQGGHLASLQALAKQLKLKRVLFKDPVFGEGKVQLMAAASLFALPTRSENFAMTVAESLAVGTPVISSKGAPWEGLVSNRCGWWVDHGPDPLASALREAMALPAGELQAMGARGRRWMERDFSWNQLAGMMLDAYRWRLEGGEPPAHIRRD